MTREKFFERLGAYLVVSLLIGIVLSFTIGPGFVWVFAFSLLAGLPIIFVESKPLTFGYVVAIWAALLVVYVSPKYFPGIYDGITSGTASADYKFGKSIRASADEKNRVSTDAGCRELIDQNNKNYDDAVKDIVNSNASPGDKADAIVKVKSATDAELEKIKSSCDEAPHYAIADYVVSSSSSGSTNTSSPSISGKVVRTVTIDAQKPLTDTGYDIPSNKKVFVTVVGSNCWDNGGQNPFRQCGEGMGPFPDTVVANQPIGELLAKVGKTYQGIGHSATIAAPKGRLMLGMNDIPGHFFDNHGSLTVQIIEE